MLQLQDDTSMNEQVWSRIRQIWKITWVRVVLYIGIWTLFALFYAIQLYFVYGNRTDVYALSWELALIREFSYWSIWALLTPAIIWLVGKYRITQQNWWRSILVHLFAAGLFSFIHLILYILLLWLVDPTILISSQASDTQSLLVRLTKSIVIMNFNTRYLIYWVILFFSHALYYYKRAQAGELRNSQLQTKLAQAHLEALRMQLHPHFLFNTLHAISSLMHTDVDAADRMITRLSDLLRMTLDKINSQEVRLKEELEILEKYLEIEQIRFGDRLKVEYTVSPDILDAYVPNLILQPLVENAIAHGIAPHAEGGTIQIRASALGEQLSIDVSDNGRGMTIGQQRNFKQGIGLANTRARLQQLYGEEQSFVIINQNNQGFSAVMKIPYRADNV